MKTIRIFDAMKKYYNDNSRQISDTIAELRCGTDQTIVNYMFHREKVDVKYLPSCYNLQDLYRKNLLFLTGKEYWTDDLHHLDRVGFTTLILYHQIQ